VTPPIRPATAADTAAIEALAEAAYAPYVARMGRRPGPMDDDYVARVAAGQAFVMAEGGRLLGYVVLIPEADALLLDTVAVDAAARGRGLGRALVAFAEAQARALGLPRVRLYTHATMTENRALYPRLGYGETGRAVEKGFDRVYFEKRLEGGACA
jgi:ribosomal protein S18 acetylase RimI-like enzyme